jgi:hypothetical protein
MERRASARPESAVAECLQRACDAAEVCALDRIVPRIVVWP